MIRRIGAWARQYWHPCSIAFWASVASIVTGLAQVAGLNHPAWGHIAQFLSLLTGGAGTAAAPAALIFGGLVGLGMRAKMGQIEEKVAPK